MARLNEPASASDPAPTESTDTLKRRFLRQNREIAKANSAQSVRIRNLETEVAQLLSENLSLRGTIISLQRQLDRNKVDNVLDGVESVKGRLEAKVQELNELVKELGDTHNRARRRTLAVTVSCPRTKALDQWNTMQEQRKAYAQSETVREEEEKLAPIVEDKYYPRKTLSADEIHAISLGVNANTSFSPIIGSPPIARIEQDSEENDGELTQLPTNLETRRRRRNSIRKGEFTVLHTQKPEIFQESDPDLRHPEEPSTKLVRAGSKRKFDFAENQQISSSSVPDDVSFLRKGATGKNCRPSAAKRENGVSSRATQDLANARGILQEKSREISQRKTTQGRKALAPSKRNISSRISHLLKVFGTDKVSSESTNTEPASPTKRGDKPALPFNDAQKGPNAASSMVRNEEQKGGPKSVDITLTKVTDSLPIVKIKQEDIEPEPETPAGFDLFSPPSSKPSTARQDSRDTPPPPELDPSMSTADALHAGRISRRAKSSVSYAEPNLRDKMRRPTKEMVDAVTGEGKGHRMSGVKLENGQYDREVGNSATERPSIRTVLIKKEEGSDGNWKNAPPSSREQRYRAGATSPLNGKSAAIEQLDNLGDANIGSDRSRRRMSTYSEEPRLPDDKLSSAAAAVTISTLVNGSKGIAEHGRRKEAAPLERRNEDPDIYNFDANSPPRKPPKISREELARSRASRRLSSVSSVQSTGSEESESEVDALGAKRSSRRQTLGGGAGRGKREETTAGGELRGAKSAAALSSQAEKGSQGRADGRRRSMMV